MSQNERWKPQSPLVTAPDVPERIASHSVLAIHCGAIWDGYDKIVDARLQPLREEFEGRIGIYALDIDDMANWPFLQEVGVVNIPTVLCFIHGKRHAPIYGTQSEVYMREQFQKLLVLADAAPKKRAELKRASRPAQNSVVLKVGR